MQKINYILTLTTLSALLAACGSAGVDDLEAKKQKLGELRAHASELNSQISTLEKEIKAEDPGYGSDEKAAVLVSVTKLEKKSFEHKVEIRGSVASKKNVLLSAETMGKIETIHVREGQAVSKGQLLVSLDSDVIRNNIRQVTSQLDLAKQVFERQERLWKQNIGTEIQYLEAKTSKETLESQLAVLNSQLSMTMVKAPFDGVVDNIPARLGEIAQPGLPLVRLVNPDDIYILADVSESFLGKFSRNQEVEIYFPSQKRKVTSKIKSVGQTIKYDNRTFELEVELPKLDFPAKPNQVVVLTLTDYQNESLVVPTEVIQGDSEGNYVYALSLEEGKQIAHKKHIKLGASYDLKTEVLNGLNEGQVIVIKGHRDLSEGVEVSVVN